MQGLATQQYWPAASLPVTCPLLVPPPLQFSVPAPPQSTLIPATTFVLFPRNPIVSSAHSWPFQQLSGWVPDGPLCSESSGPCYCLGYLLLVRVCVPLSSIYNFFCFSSLSLTPLSKHLFEPGILRIQITLHCAFQLYMHCRRISLTKFFLCVIIWRRMLRVSKKS